MHRLLVVTVLVACGTAPATQDGKPEPLAFEAFSPPQFTSHDVFLAAHGDVIVLRNRISRDGGTTWEPSSLGSSERVAIHANLVAAYTTSLVRYDLATKALSPVAGAPAYTSARTWRTNPAGRIIVFDPIRNAIAIEGSSEWTSSTLPQPTPTQFDPYITDVESNGTTLVVVSGWGVYRSVDGGASFERVIPASANIGRELVALADRRFALLGGAKTLRLDSIGDIVGESAGVTADTGEALACDDGALLARGKISKDGGASWQPMLISSALTLTIERVGCGGGRYWVLGHSPSWGYRLLRYDTPQGPGIVVGSWELAGDIAWSASGPPIVRSAGELIVAGLAWGVSDASWSWRELPAKAWSAAGMLYGITDKKFFASTDAGRSWRLAGELDLGGDVDAFARGPDGTLYVSRFTSESTTSHDRWHSTVWRSVDGATWSIAYDAQATRESGKNTVGEAHRFIGVNAAGEWIATDAISQDAGATWAPTEFAGDNSRAFITPQGHLVTPRGDVWHVFEAAGLGKLVGTWDLEVDGVRVPASELLSVAFDEAGHAYVARGRPYVQVWRSQRSIVRD